MGEEYKRTVQTYGFIPFSKDIILWDDIEGVLKWTGEGNAGDWVVDRISSVDGVMDGVYGLRLQTRVTTPAIDDWARATRKIGLRKWYVVRVSFNFRLPNTEVSWRFISSPQFMDGAFWYNPMVRHLGGAKKWQYLDSGGAWQDIPGGGYEIHNEAWNYCEYTVSFRDKILKTFQCNELFLVDLNLPIRVFSFVVPQNLLFLFEIQTAVAGSKVAYIDNVLIQEEA